MLASLLFLLLVFALAQRPECIKFIRNYGGTGEQIATSVVQTKDGGYAIAGVADFNTDSNGDFWLVKTDKWGNMQWNATYGGKGWDEAHSVVQTNDGGYAIAGHTYSFGAGRYDYWLVKVDVNGKIQWNKTYGEASDDEANCVVQARDGGYALAGYSQSDRSHKDSWLVKTDSNGNMQWNMTYGGANDDEARTVIQTSDAGYTLAGYTNSFGSADSDYWLVKTDASGSIQWNRTYGIVSSDGAYSTIQTRDGGYALVGRIYSPENDTWSICLVKTDSTGNMQWNRTTRPTSIGAIYSMTQANDGGYALAGCTDSLGGYYTGFLLVKTDANGDVQWYKTFGGQHYHYASSIVRTSDGGYAIAGRCSAQDQVWTYDFGLVKTDATGESPNESSSPYITLLTLVFIARVPQRQQTGPKTVMKPST
jgi:hypothetical protein